MKHKKTQARVRLILMPMPQISQQELARLQSLKNQMELIRHEIFAMAESVRVRLEASVEVEPGIHHAWMHEHREGTTTIRRVVLNGAPLE